MPVNPVGFRAPAEYVLYGYLDTGVPVPHPSAFEAQNKRIAVHRQGFITVQEAEREAVIARLTGGKLVGVIVRLDHQMDVNGQRHVVRRINGGQAWWE